MEPGSGVLPPALGGGHGDAEGGGGFVEVEADEVAELDELGLFRVEAGVFLERFVEGDEPGIGEGGGDGTIVELDPLESAAVADGLAGAGAVDEDVAHGFAGGAEVVAAVFPGGLIAAAEAEPGFVDESGGLEGAGVGLAREFGGGEPSQLLVNERQPVSRGGAGRDEIWAGVSQRAKDYG